MDRRGGEKFAEDHPWISTLLVPFSIFYGTAVGLNRRLFRWGIRGSRVLPRPVVSVGNISIGGAGKTPLVMWLASRLQERGIKVAILTRGYGGKRSSPGEVVMLHGNEGANIDPLVVGDEPLLMAGRLGDVPIFISSQRYRAGEVALKNGNVDLFILDDGFQHFPLARDLEIVAVDDRRRFGTGRLLPAGVLREPASRLAEADIIVVTKAQAVDAGFEEEIRRHTDADLCWADFRPLGIRAFNGDEILDPVEFEGTKFLTFSGIADAKSFEATAGKISCAIRGNARFKDHHPYGEGDVRALMDMAGKVGADAFLTTEKDAVRWPGRLSGLPCYALVMEPVFLHGEKILMEKVISLVDT
ncbi:MAG: tetraacyldisaccharide 4'-kinase [Deltaproteobacteria bacterium]|nr:tetraacyldisaccharide 4'-kinase [Deltaproteobacteria bacterium]